jgi:hypothetical protein
MQFLRLKKLLKPKPKPKFKPKLKSKPKPRKNAIFVTFRFNTQVFPESGKLFSLQKCQIRTPRMFLLLEGSFPEKIFEHFYSSGWPPPYCVIAPYLVMNKI